MKDEIVLHYWPTPNGWKISIALEELNQPYKVNLININNGDQMEKFQRLLITMKQKT